MMTKSLPVGIVRPEFVRRCSPMILVRRANIFMPQSRLYCILTCLGALSVLCCLILLHRTHIVNIDRFRLFDAMYAEDAPVLSSAKHSHPDYTLLVDTPGCRIPAMAPFSSEVQSFVYDYESLECGNPPPLVESNDTALFVVKEVMRAYNATLGLECCYTAMWRFAAAVEVPGWGAELGSGVDEPSNPLYDAKLYGNDIRFANECVPFRDSAVVEHEFVKVLCSVAGKVVYEDYHGFVPLKTPSTGRDKDVHHESGRSLNVLIVGVDAVSRLNFLRTMPRTAELLKETLHAVSMQGFNKVEDNTFPNMVPLFTGLSLPELSRTCWKHKDAHFDACPWIWKRFNRNGYVNAFAEDTAWMGLFHYLKKGFINQPTDYDARPLLYVGEKRLGRGKGLNAKVCIGQRFQIQVLFGYASKFVRKMHMNKRKFFGHFWGTSLSHDFLNQPDEADTLYVRFLMDLINSGVLNSTALVFMSDHGLRWGKILSTYQGYLEERLPFMHLVLPDWFRKRYAFALDSLKLNANRLVTVFDLHRTLLDLMDLRSLEKRSLQQSLAGVQNAYRKGAPPRGISLFVPIPDVRRCVDAGIPTHYCACQRLKSISANDSVVLQVAKFVVEYINTRLSDYSACEPLAVHNVLAARRGAHVFNSTTVMFREHEYQLTLRTRPGLALLSATVRHQLDTGTMQISGTITRLNAYGGQSWCMSDSKLKLYCYCR